MLRPGRCLSPSLDTRGAGWMKDGAVPGTQGLTDSMCSNSITPLLPLPECTRPSHSSQQPSSLPFYRWHMEAKKSAQFAKLSICYMAEARCEPSKGPTSLALMSTWHHLCHLPRMAHSTHLRYYPSPVSAPGPNSSRPTK